MSTAELAAAPPRRTGEGWLILRVALPRLARRVERIQSWLDRYTPERPVQAADELRAIGGAEGLALLAAVPPDRRAVALERAEVDETDRQRLKPLLDRLGDPEDEQSPAAGLVKMFPSIVEPSLEVPGDDQRAVISQLRLAGDAFARGAYREARERAEWIRRLHATIGSTQDRYLELANLNLLGRVNTVLGDSRQATEVHQLCLEVAGEVGNTQARAAAWHGLASIDLNEGRYEAARQKFAKSLALEEQIGNRRGEAATLHGLASIDLKEGNLVAAREKFTRVLALLQELGNDKAEAATWHQLATIDLNEGKYAEARARFARALTLKQESGDRQGEAATWHQLATIDAEEGSYAAAKEKLAKSLAMKQVIGDIQGEAATWHQLASIDLYEEQFLAAREKFDRALALVTKICDRQGEAATWHGLATIDAHEGRYGEARAKFARSLAIRQEIGDRQGEAATFYQLGVLAGAQDQILGGAKLIGVCVLLTRAIGHADLAKATSTLHDLYQQLGIPEVEIQSMLETIGKSYQRDRGRSLLEAAFPAWE